MTRFTVQEQEGQGQGLFAAISFRQGERVLEFRGALLAYADIPDEGPDRYLQVGPGRYIGPSGEPDDLANHSCEPNCELVMRDDAAWLVAARQIEPGDAITFDYRLSLFHDSTWSFPCRCGERGCCGIVGT